MADTPLTAQQIADAAKARKALEIKRDTLAKRVTHLEESIEGLPDDVSEADATWFSDELRRTQAEIRSVLPGVQLRLTLGPHRFKGALAKGVGQLVYRGRRRVRSSVPGHGAEEVEGRQHQTLRPPTLPPAPRRRRGRSWPRILPSCHTARWMSMPEAPPEDIRRWTAKT